jgi:heptosyltransferase-2
VIDNVARFPARASKPQRLAAMAMLATRLGSPDLLLDLQRSAPSLLLGRMLRPNAWVAFDRFAPRTALDRYLDACRWVGLNDLQPRYITAVKESFAATESSVLRKLLGDTISVDGPLVCLNPAGSWPTKNWPVSEYIGLAEMMMEEWNARIVMLGTENILQGASSIREALGDRVIDLVGRTTLAEAFALVRNLDLMVRDDSGLMQMGGVSGVPSVGIFGASRSVWSRPCGEHSYCFGSEDLECGACMSDVCGRGDLLCLQRVSAEAVMEQCRRVMRQ